MKKKTILSILTLIILIASLFIGVGLYLNNLSKPVNIFAKGIDIIKNKTYDYTSISKDLNIKDTYTKKGEIDFDLDSEYYNRLKTKDEEALKKYNVITNLNKSSTSFLIQKNQNKKIGYIELNQSIDKNEIINAKYYIADSTKYYLINSIRKEYVNDGSCNYFENINKDTTEKDNIDYLYNFIFDSLKNNLKDEYFKNMETKENINDLEKNVYEVSIKLNNTNVKDIINGILKDLKNDKRSSKIIKNTNPDILKLKLKDNTIILNDNEYYEIYIYTTKLLHKPLKYKIVHTNDNVIDTYIYENINNRGNFYYLNNDMLKYKGNIEFNKNQIISKVFDTTDKQIGEFKLEHDKYATTINYNFDNFNTGEKIDLIYSNKYTNIKNNKSFDNTKTLSFKYTINEEIKLNGDISINMNVESSSNILVDVSNAVLKSNLSEEEKDKVNNYMESVINKLEK